MSIALETRLDPVLKAVNLKTCANKESHNDLPHQGARTRIAVQQRMGRSFQNNQAYE